MQKLTDWFFTKGLPIICLVIICVVFPAAIYFWKSHPDAEQAAAISESSALPSGMNPDLQLPENATAPPLPAGTPAIDFTSKTVDGVPYAFHSRDPNIKVVEFWATWCGPCHMSLPFVEDLYSNLKAQGVEVVGVSVDTDTVSRVKPLAKHMGLTYPVLIDAENNPYTQLLYNATSLPCTYIIDGKGIVRWSFSGYWPLEEPYVRQIISNLQAGKPVGLS
jgi:peroxiredoxin